MNFTLLKNCLIKIQNLGLKASIFKTFESKIKLLSTANFLCWKFAAVCQKKMQFLVFLLLLL